MGLPPCALGLPHAPKMDTRMYTCRTCACVRARTCVRPYMRAAYVRMCMRARVRVRVRARVRARVSEGVQTQKKLQALDKPNAPPHVYHFCTPSCLLVLLARMYGRVYLEAYIHLCAQRNIPTMLVELAAALQQNSKLKPVRIRQTRL